MSTQPTKPLSSIASEEIIFRKPTIEDGKPVFDFIQRCGTLERNTAYCYFLLCSHFAESCAIAEHKGEIIGYLAGYCLPEQRDAYFVWQVGVSAEARGHGLAGRLIENVLDRKSLGLRYVKATVDPGNAASIRVFQKFAEQLHAPFEKEEFLKESHFGDLGHAAEDMYTIGPIPTKES